MKMKIVTSVLAIALLAGCATVKPDERHSKTHAWDVSLSPIGANEYEFDGRLTCVASTVREAGSRCEGSGHENVLYLPKVSVRAGIPAETAIGEPGQEPAVRTVIHLQETNALVVVEFTAEIQEDGESRHTVHGKLEIRK